MPVSDSNACLGVRLLGIVGVGAQHHRDSGRGWAEELGQICDGVRKSYALAPAYQGDIRVHRDRKIVGLYL